MRMIEGLVIPKVIDFNYVDSRIAHFVYNHLNPDRINPIPLNLDHDSCKDGRFVLEAKMAYEFFPSIKESFSDNPLLLNNLLRYGYIRDHSDEISPRSSDFDDYLKQTFEDKIQAIGVERKRLEAIVDKNSTKVQSEVDNFKWTKLYLRKNNKKAHYKIALNNIVKRAVFEHNAVWDFLVEITDKRFKETSLFDESKDDNSDLISWENLVNKKIYENLIDSAFGSYCGKRGVLISTEKLGDSRFSMYEQFNSSAFKYIALWATENFQKLNFSSANSGPYRTGANDLVIDQEIYSGFETFSTELMTLLLRGDTNIKSSWDGKLDHWLLREKVEELVNKTLNNSI